MGAQHASNAYPHLLSPLQVGHLRLRNRVVMGSMHTKLEDRRADLPKLAAFFAERARGGVGMIVTGGYAPTWRGWLSPFSSTMASTRLADAHTVLTDAAHEHGAAILLQLLHAGRYAYHPFSQAPSAVKSPITPFRPLRMSDRAVSDTVDAFARAASLARRAGYDGVEVMGSEGYLINQFLAPRTNDRDDRWGGSAERRRRFAREIVRRIRDQAGDDFLIQYRISLIDLVDEGQSWDETLALAHELQDAGVSLFSSGIGWHEARVPTIVTSVPRAAFAGLAGRLRRQVTVPVIASNRINRPETAEQILARGDADLVSMARPLLADAELVTKATTGREREIITCIACNQACLDHTFTSQRVSCLLNPRSGFETELLMPPTPAPRRIAVVGAGPAGLAASVELAGRGHRVDLFEASDAVGGQFRLAARIPGKEEFRTALDYYTHMLQLRGVRVHRHRRAGVEDLRGFDEVVVATGVRPRIPGIPGIDHPSVVTYQQLLAGEADAGPRVAVIGAGGIGFDVAEFLLHDPDETLDHWRERWGVADPAVHRGGITTKLAAPARRTVYLLQRTPGRLGASLGKTTGWVHRTTLRDAGVTMLGGVEYRTIDDRGLHVTLPGPDKAKRRKHPAAKGLARVERTLPVDTVVICAGQESVRDLVGDLTRTGVPVHVIGGADVAAELDAKRAIRQATELAARM
ncbi:MAG: NADPH-dependent 2,4-dienoyl-CoA reductase [Propioniciclava sp.]|uniref:oxidoreductase n=1 Tax=Propioniciclava sp. TaxID=2038686 RepID=UPI0039E389C3